MSDDAKSRPVTREQAEEAVRTLLLWSGEDPTREGLLDTPARVAKAYRELFGGPAQQDANGVLRFLLGRAAGGLFTVRKVLYDGVHNVRSLPVRNGGHVFGRATGIPGGEFCTFGRLRGFRGGL